jgi:hypothetical protein
MISSPQTFLRVTVLAREQLSLWTGWRGLFSNGLQTSYKKCDARRLQAGLFMDKNLRKSVPVLQRQSPEAGAGPIRWL